MHSPLKGFTGGKEKENGNSERHRQSKLSSACGFNTFCNFM